MGLSRCQQCRLRAAYDRNPRSLLGRFWRWHIKWCPGWRSYFRSLSPQEQQELREKYRLP